MLLLLLLLLEQERVNPSFEYNRPRSIYRLDGCINLKVVFQSAHRIKSFFPYKDRINCSQISKVGYHASSWDCQDFYIEKTKRIDCMTEKLNILKRSRETVLRLLSQTTSRQLVTT